MDKQSIAQSMAAYRDAMVEATVTLCAIPSVKGRPETGAPFGLETKRSLDAFLALGAELGFTPVDLDGYCGYLDWGSEGPITAVLGHLDVVPAIDGWSHDPFTPVVSEDRIIARGTADDKGPLVSALYAMKALKDDGFTPRGRIRLIAGLDEESGSECMRHYTKVAELPAAGFTPDANFPVIYAEKGIAHVKILLKSQLEQPFAKLDGQGQKLVAAVAGQRANMVPARCDLTWQDEHDHSSTETYTGKAAHASLPWEGHNAIGVAMAAAAQRPGAHPMVKLYQALLADDWTGKALGIAGQDSSGPLTLNPGMLKLDQEQGLLILDIRYPASWQVETILNQMSAAVSPFHATVELVSHTAPLAGDPERPLVKTLMNVYNRLTGASAAPVAIGGGTYARAMPNIVAFGPSFPGEPDVCHQVDEFITIEKLLASAAIYREALRELAG
ncbi:MAG: Sapep family Mn(2+)-dependent dipeptidase [Eubacteriales bacterium]|nr:Sapep family Mn(2+)-dependent dipeptidase [Eubacteriales bacterium]